MSGALQLLAIDAANGAEKGLNADEIVERIRLSKPNLKTIAMIDDLSRIQHIANAPKMLLTLAKTLNIKPVVAFSDEGFQLVAKPFSIQDGMRRMIRIIADDIGSFPSKFVVFARRRA